MPVGFFFSSDPIGGGMCEQKLPLQKKRAGKICAHWKKITRALVIYAEHIWHLIKSGLIEIKINGLNYGMQLVRNIQLPLCRQTLHEAFLISHFGEKKLSLHVCTMEKGRGQDRTEISALAPGRVPAPLRPCWVTFGKSHLISDSLWKHFVVSSGVAIFRNKALLSQ